MMELMVIRNENNTKRLNIGPFCILPFLSQPWNKLALVFLKKIKNKAYGM